MKILRRSNSKKNLIENEKKWESIKIQYQAHSQEQNLPTSPAMPTILAGCGIKGSDLLFSAIITTFDDLEATLTPEKAAAEDSNARARTELNILLKRFF